MATYASMKREIIRTVGKEAFADIASFGADTGWPGFTYYSDTCKFFVKYRDVILDIARQDADSFGTSVIEMVRAFRCLNNDYSLDEVGRAIYGKFDPDDIACRQIANAMAWYALEYVAREETGW